jgi:hypothetical protein
MVPAVVALSSGCATGAIDEPYGASDEAALNAGDSALVGVSAESRVGVLLDEVPASLRGRLEADLLARPPAFWIERAKKQLKLTTFRLVFRKFNYPNTGRQSLPLPPEEIWKITPGAPRKVVVDGHQLVVVDYRFASTLLTSSASPAASEPQLGTIGGQWNEPFVLPIDPELVFQRTGFACMNEAATPPDSLDAEEMPTFFDHGCQVEPRLSNLGCHQSGLPKQSCVDALAARIGSVRTNVRFERLPWNIDLARSVRVGKITVRGGADLVVEKDEFRVNRVTYRYIPPGDCTIDEKCVAAPGWRKLLQFGGVDRNTGDKPVVIGRVDYFLQGNGTPLSENNVLELSACHKHYHFTHYGTFSFGDGDDINAKRGFCLESTNRYSNLPQSPLDTHFDCNNQGVDVGWVDQYKPGLPCQWLDVTDVDTANGPVTKELKFASNPDGFLCEGKPVVDAQGRQRFEATEFTTAAGAPVRRPMCEFAPGALDNNTDAYPATVPPDGGGYVTLPCTGSEVGPLRNCGLEPRPEAFACTPGTRVRLQCSVPAGSVPQVLRVCERSNALGSGIACTYQEAYRSVNVDAGGTDLTFACPGERGPGEPGGSYAFYTGPTIPGDPSAPVSCTATELPATCPLGDGLYCGDPDEHRHVRTLYRCAAGKYTVAQRCKNGCRTTRPGESDECF